MMRPVRLAWICYGFGMAAIAAPGAPTFDKDILPILQKNCQGCHRPGEIAPMSLLTFEQARPWAKSIKAAVLSKKMPPWFAQTQGTHTFSNDRTLSAADLNTLVSWVDNGAPEGDSKDAPAPLQFQDGWNIRPDLVIEMPQDFRLPAKGTINYQYVLVKGNFTQDVWVSEAEMRPGNPKVLHHGKVWVRPPGSQWMEDAVPGVPYEAGMGRNTIEDGNDILGKFNPGLGAQDFSIGGAAKFVPKGSDLVFELHYTAVGEATTDRSRLGLVFAKSAPSTRYFLSAGPTALNLLIPPGDSNAEVVSEVTVGADNVRLAYVQPHLHLRGKAYELRLIYPTGESETLLSVPKYNFSWQLSYEEAKPLSMPKGTRIECTAHHDNSANNPYNPNPNVTVRWGDQTWEEMMMGFFAVVVDANVKPQEVIGRAAPRRAGL